MRGRERTGKVEEDRDVENGNDVNTVLMHSILKN